MCSFRRHQECVAGQNPEISPQMTDGLHKKFLSKHLHYKIRSHRNDTNPSKAAEKIESSHKMRSQTRTENFLAYVYISLDSFMEP